MNSASAIRLWAALACFVVASPNLDANQVPPTEVNPPSMLQKPPAAGSAAPASPSQPAVPQSGAESGSCCGPVCQPQMIEQTCYVPTPFHEKRTVQCVQYRTEQRAQQVTVMHVVPEKQTITRDCLVLVPERALVPRTTRPARQCPATTLAVVAVTASMSKSRGSASSNTRSACHIPRDARTTLRSANTCPSSDLLP